MLKQVWLISGYDLAKVGLTLGFPWNVSTAALKLECFAGQASAVVFKNSIQDFQLNSLRTIFKCVFDENPLVDMITVINDLEN